MPNILWLWCTGRAIPNPIWPLELKWSVQLRYMGTQAHAPPIHVNSTHTHARAYCTQPSMEGSRSSSSSSWTLHIHIGVRRTHTQSIHTRISHINECDVGKFCSEKLSCVRIRYKQCCAWLPHTMRDDCCLFVYVCWCVVYVCCASICSMFTWLYYFINIAAQQQLIRSVPCMCVFMVCWIALVRYGDMERGSTR